MGEILMTYRAKVAAAVAEVQRKDAELDARVAAARQSFSISDSSTYNTDETDVVRSPNGAEDIFQCTTHLGLHLSPMMGSLRVEIPPMSKSQASSTTVSAPNGNNQPFSPFFKLPTGDTLTIDATDAITYVMNDISKSRRIRWRSIAKYAKGSPREPTKTRRMSSSNFYSLLSKAL